MSKIIRVSTKRSKIKKKKLLHLNVWINKNGPTTKLIDWYLQDEKSLKWLQTYCDQLEREYTKDLDGNTRIKWNHLNILLNNHGMIPDIKEKFFQSFLYTGKRSIKKLAFHQNGDGSIVPVSLI